jgi:hypothetical protein
MADLGRHAVEAAAALHFLDAAGAHLVGPPPGEEREDREEGHHHRQHRQRDDADHHQPEHRHRQVEDRLREAAGDGAAHRADVAEVQVPHRGRPRLERAQRTAEHGAHQRTRDAVVDDRARVAQQARTARAQPELDAQEEQDAADQRRQRRDAAAREHAVVDLQQEDRGQQPEQADRNGAPGRALDQRVGITKRGVEGARIGTGTGLHGPLGDQLSGQEKLDHGRKPIPSGDDATASLSTVTRLLQGNISL